ncbi:hypothetical protein SAV14893_023390 [Streptomyces avermitilis]|uniref:TerD domain-containing protein n=1 Tax=Streptomyces avermitilis TaxID=33903 RepID=A0A4D4LU99_STRAX|nr:hypothetical protein SAV14893_023390 [Streptomyces avermitilis]
MAREFQRGHKAKISDLTAGTDLYVGVQITGPGLTFDISCFGLDAEERLSDDRYFIFFNQPKTPEESIQLLGAQAGDTESFRVTLDRIPPQIQKLSFTATLDGAGQMSQVAPGYLRIVAGGEEVARYSFTGSEFSTERAVMLGDFYLKDVWRFAAVGQGFDGGLDALLKNFGGEVAEEEPAVPAQTQSGAAPSFAPPAFGAPAAPAPAPAPAPQPAQGFTPPRGPRRLPPRRPHPPCTPRRPSSGPCTPRRAALSRRRVPHRTHSLPGSRVRRRDTDSSLPARPPRCRPATASNPRARPPATASSRSTARFRGRCRPVSTRVSPVPRPRTAFPRAPRRAVPVWPPRCRSSRRRPPVSAGRSRTRS